MRFNQYNELLQIVANHKDGIPTGIYSICSANKFVIEAAIAQAKIDKTSVCIESTSNQVNQFGGYTGLTPSQFVLFVLNIAKKLDFPTNRIILGADHLGPNAWKNEKCKSAMEKAKELIKQSVIAGYKKIHLDASMRCADDPMDERTPVDYKTIANRTADLCCVSEKTYNSKMPGPQAPLYIIGTDVPKPGGSKELRKGISVTTIDELEKTITTIRNAFFAHGLDDAWDRVIAVVVQTGVEFGDNFIFKYDHRKAQDLSLYIEKQQNLIYEAHSTDYQLKEDLKQMVKDHFAILKVGPWLTFAFREAIFALEAMELELLSGKTGVELSNISRILDKAMLADPKYWEKHYRGDNFYLNFARKFSYSDRCRYYWINPTVNRAIEKLIMNLTQHSIPITLLSQYMPVQYHMIRLEKLSNNPLDLIRHKIMEVTSFYSHACGK